MPDVVGVGRKVRQEAVKEAARSAFVAVRASRAQNGDIAPSRAMQASHRGGKKLVAPHRRRPAEMSSTGQLNTAGQRIGL